MLENFVEQNLRCKIFIGLAPGRINICIMLYDPTCLGR